MKCEKCGKKLGNKDFPIVEILYYESGKLGKKGDADLIVEAEKINQYFFHLSCHLSYIDVKKFKKKLISDKLKKRKRGEK